MEEIREELETLRCFVEDKGNYELVSGIERLIDLIEENDDLDENSDEYDGNSFDINYEICKSEIDFNSMIDESELCCPYLSRYLLDSFC